MPEGGTGAESEPPDFIERETLGLSLPRPDAVALKGHDEFPGELRRLFRVDESNAAEELVKLKDQLRRAADIDTFWKLLTEGLVRISGGQFSFVSRRMTVDDENDAVELPPIGDIGSCLMGAAFYVNDGKEMDLHLRNIKYHAYSCPCAYMRYDRVFIIPEKLNEFIIENPNKMLVPGEAYIGVPLFAEGKCFGHFGVLWTPEGAPRRTLSWNYIEILFHSLEDMVADRLLREAGSPKIRLQTQGQNDRIFPHEAIAMAQSLKPYARSLSHELRTPMHGVVGMLDIMYATVQEAAEGQKDAQIRKVFEMLKENIETVQDSSRRAVEAADNVVHAYDMNMGLPDLPSSPLEDGEEAPAAKISAMQAIEIRPEMVVTGTNRSLNMHRKRRMANPTWENTNRAKQHLSDVVWEAHRRDQVTPERKVNYPTRMSVDNSPASNDRMSDRGPRSASPVFASAHTVVPGLRHASLREVLQYVINDSLKVGGRPESAIARETDGGEIIEVRTRSPEGEEQIKIIEWFVDSNIPETILVDEKDLAKVVSCVVLNAIKFTDEGSITITARLSPKSRYVVIKVLDTGSGIEPAFLPNLFKPFAREDDSLTRQSEGLGLGLLVAKGLARRLGGDLYCLRSDIMGPRKGSEFEIRVPLTPGDTCSRPGSPFGSRSPSVRSRPSTDMDLSSVEPIGAPRTPPPGLRDVRRATIASTSHPPQPAYLSIPSPRSRASPRRHNAARRTFIKRTDIDRNLARKYPLNFLVVEDNKINRKLLVSMLHKFGYTSVCEAYDGADAVRQMSIDREDGKTIDVILMDLWMPFMDGYEAAEKILQLQRARDGGANPPTILAVTADVTEGALERAARVGMKGFMAKPYKLLDLERLIVEYCARRVSIPVQPTFITTS